MLRQYNIMVVDDESAYQNVFQMILEDKGYAVFTANCVKEAKNILKEQEIDLVITDMVMKNGSGLDLLTWVKDYDNKIGVIMVTAYATVESAVEAIRKGAYNYFIKSSDPEALIYDIERFFQLKILKDENTFLRGQQNKGVLLISKSERFKKILEICHKIARSNISVLILGESGVGKEVIARYIHELSERSSGNFVPVNCQMYSEGVLESELFGHEKGSFTGASQKRIGKFEIANTGTLFLDEIADISLSTQTKLLRVLENKKIERVGSNREIQIDCRLITATNRDIYMKIATGELREDLLYRINGITINIPPLRDRKEDIELFIEFFIHKFESELKKKIKYFDERAMDFLKNYSYPGNIRELKNIIERLVVLCDNNEILYSDVVANLQQQEKYEFPREEKSLRRVRADIEKNYIMDLVERYDGDLSLVARTLEITRRQLSNKILEYNLKPWINKNFKS